MQDHSQRFGPITERVEKWRTTPLNPSAVAKLTQLFIVSSGLKATRIQIASMSVLPKQALLFILWFVSIASSHNLQLTDIWESLLLKNNKQSDKRKKKAENEP